ncbi:MAG: LysM peptidoglycan-binding domain-containing protein [Candidatus Levybacteria bacterium]|nr:LysM peptidoglycan-binding domain-containing protein [Candidatus Levybacteria bacterium]
MAKKIITTEEVQADEPERSGNGFFDYLRFGESYTSLILGIVVVIISTALLLSFFNNRDAVPTNPVTQESQSIAQISQRAIALSGTPKATGTVDSQAATTGPAATKAPNVTPTVMPTVKPTEAAKVAQATTAPVKEETKVTTPTAGEYVVKAGDTLWTIAEKQYKSGYNWVDIARANNLSNPDQISTGNKLKLPKVTAKAATVVDTKKQVAKNDQQKTTVEPSKITVDTYKVVKGDSLWTVAVRAYGDGYKWVDIAKANKLTNPNVIHVNNQLKLPRGK